MKGQQGFTLIELMLVVAILGILSAIAVPVLGTTIRRAQEGCTKADLKMLRDALTRYAADHDGVYPSDDLTSLVTQGYINKIPVTRTPPHHRDGNVVRPGSMSTQYTHTGNWFYFFVPNESRYGEIIVNCNHETLSGQPWNTL